MGSPTGRLRAHLLLCIFSLCECARLHRLHGRGNHSIFAVGSRRAEPCGVTTAATSRSELGRQCPAECPLHQEDRTGDAVCSFQCVPATWPDCKALNANAAVPDPKRGICRACWIPGCERCAEDGTDSCAKCRWSFRLRDGQCTSIFRFAWYVVLGLVVGLVALVVVWAASLGMRPVTNEFALDKGLELRSRAKLHMPVAVPEVSADAEQEQKPEPAKAPESTKSASAWESSYGMLDSWRGWLVVSEDIEDLDDNMSVQHATGDEKERSTRVLWPLSTNLCRQDVAGPGVVLSFNFQAAVIIWALVVVAIWASLAYGIDTDLLSMGIGNADTPRDHCITLARGFETSRRLMWVTVDFLMAVYVVSFLGSLLHSILQLRRFQALDELESTHRDYAVKVTGIPPTKGYRKLEEELKKALESATGKVVVGVSVCWVFSDEGQADLLRNTIDLDIRDQEHTLAGRRVSHEENPDDSTGLASVEQEERERTRVARFFGGFERMLIPTSKMRLRRHRRHKEIHKHEAMLERRRVKRLSFNPSETLEPIRSESLEPRDTPSYAVVQGTQSPAGRVSEVTGTAAFLEDVRHFRSAMRPLNESSSQSPVETESIEFLQQDNYVKVVSGKLETVVRDELEKMTHAGEAYAIFSTEADRNEALRIVGDEGLEFEGSSLFLAEAMQDPDSILWENCGSLKTWGDLLRKLAVGSGVVVAALIVWVLAFFGPYAYFVTNSTYTYGQDPSFIQGMFFAMIVVGGNAIMYQVCSEVADGVGFHLADDREVCYMLLYCFACMFQVVLDVFVSYQMSYARLVGRQIRTYDGTPIHELGSLTEKIESYPMQQELGRQVYNYSWPSTYLIPFLIEPFITILVPYQLMVYFVRSHRAVSVSTAEALLATIPFDLSRYADICLNVNLAVLILFFPGGYTLTLFLALVFSHIVIYLFDHWRLLRVCPSCYFSTMHVDWWVQWMLSIPCGAILSAYAFKSRSSFAHDPDDVRQGPEENLDVKVFLEVVGAFALHVLVHTVLLVHVVPMFGRREKAPTQEPYENCSRRSASSFFSTNPVHCLRSHYVYEHSPPCGFRVRGKEHLLRANPKIGCYFEDTYAQSEAYQWS